MKNEQSWIQEDWERIYDQEKTFIEEERIRIMNAQWEEYENYQRRKPATINVVVPVDKEKEVEK